VFLIEFQLLLLQESWKELFLLHLAQWSIPWDLSSLFGCSKARDRLPQDDITNNEIKTIQVINPNGTQNCITLSPHFSQPQEAFTVSMVHLVF
jgi:hypothetical protein